MSIGQIFVSALVSAVVSAGTFLMMHQLVGPQLQDKPMDVPSIVGLTTEQARGLTEPLGLLLVLDGQKEPDSDKVAAGSVLEQHPLQGSRLRKGGELHATLALPIAKVTLPAMSGQPLAVAQKAILDLGLKISSVTEQINAAVAVGAVIATEPPSGAQLRKGESVMIQVAKAADLIAVPELRRKSLGGAKQVLEQAGLALGSVRKATDDNMDDGVVLRQDPAAGTPVAKGTKVNVVVNE